MMHSKAILPLLIVGSAVAAVLLAFGTPIASLLPFVIVLGCPLMMLVMMRRMGGTGGTGGSEVHTGPGRQRDPAHMVDSSTGHRH